MAEIMKISLQLKPESMAILKTVGEQLQAIRDELNSIGASFSQALEKLF